MCRRGIKVRMARKGVETSLLITGQVFPLNNPTVF
jgi:hypothetical protein